MWTEIFKDLDAFELGESALDVGAGFGNTTRYLLARGLRVCAVDIDPGAVAYIKSLFKEFVKSGLLKVLLAPAESLPFADGECDSVISVAAVHHFRDIEVALREMVRVAKRLVAIYDWTPEAGGVTNPHSPQELEAKMRAAVDAAVKLGFDIKITRYWYRLVKF
ncbi:class I SAM-dependent methyltransferase [Pyrobaculum aerophilum]|uniref:Methyltransferase type 11 n=1 Tax=Pyrobaculum aerophilum TaxID=13773 RepID=A0A371QW68_9CREN|nr:class I SAM-dependent methyltransferase [Pyrobaculum aerophilum]RFA94465.1 methyltransferase type 11 [Pyrobaculum aerophilum]RFA95489.1 methyltransferase type 11 [Pyrobaculum aerophilum]